MGKYFSSTIQKGSQGDEVKAWQEALKSLHYDIEVNGIFDDKTLANTLEFQKVNGLVSDGIVGEETWGKAGFTSLSTPTVAPNVGKAPTAPTFNTTATAMPNTNTTSWDDTSKGQAALGSYNSAKDKVNEYGDFTYDDYVMGDAAQAAKDALDKHNANKPGAYQSQWQNQLDELMGQIMNRDKFSYNMNEDALYQQYKDQYIQQGKLAMADTMGQAAAMTGGYGSSYGQSVGQQAYQAQLQNLNDILPELYQMALNKYNQEGQDLYNQYGLVADRENLDYARYRDAVSDFMNERSFLQGVYSDERGFDYGKYVDDRNLDHALHQEGYQKLLDALGIAQSDYYSGGDVYRAEQSIKNNEAWNQYQASEEARQYANSLLQQGYQNEFGKWEADSNNAWKDYEAAEDARRDAVEDKRYDDEITHRDEREFVEDEQWNALYGEGGINNPTFEGNFMYDADGNLREGFTTTNTSFFDEDGNFKSATFSRTDEDGNSVWLIDGKEVVRQPGANPYTGTVNSDVKNGTFSNGYQPNNIKGEKLSKSGITDTINGVEQNVWKTPDGSMWIWDGTQNKYLPYDSEPDDTKVPYWKDPNYVDRFDH